MLETYTKQTVHFPTLVYSVVPANIDQNFNFQKYMDSGVKKQKKDNIKNSVNDFVGTSKDMITSLTDHSSISSINTSEKQKESQTESKVSRIFDL